MNGHADEHDTKEEEVYQDLCSIQWASRPQVWATSIRWSNKKKLEMKLPSAFFIFSFNFVR